MRFSWAVSRSLEKLTPPLFPEVPWQLVPPREHLPEKVMLWTFSKVGSYKGVQSRSKDSRQSLLSPHPIKEANRRGIRIN